MTRDSVRQPVQSAFSLRVVSMVFVRKSIAAVVLAVCVVAGCTSDTGPEYVPLSYLTLEDLETNEPNVVCGAEEYPAVIGTYEVSNTVSADTGQWQFYVGAVAVQPITGLFDIRMRGSQDYWEQLAPGESATIEIWALTQPTPGERIEFSIHYHFVPAAEADALLATLYTTELGTETVEFVWDCP